MTAGSLTKRGLLVVFEGGDRCGKSTQCEFLLKTLKACGHSVHLLQFPDRSSNTGLLLHKYLRGEIQIHDDRAVHLLFSANRWECFEKMKTLLMTGQHLLVDRYVASGIAFSMAKGLEYDWCYYADKGLMKPDITFFFDISPEAAAKRSGFGTERFEKLSFQNKVYTSYQKLHDESWKTINATLQIPEISSLVEAEVTKLMNSNMKAALQYY